MTAEESVARAKGAKPGMFYSSAQIANGLCDITAPNSGLGAIMSGATCPAVTTPSQNICPRRGALPGLGLSWPRAAGWPSHANPSWARQGCESLGPAKAVCAPTLKCKCAVGVHLCPYTCMSVCVTM